MMIKGVKKEYKKAIATEVFGGRHMPFYIRFYRKHFMPQYNCVYLIRKMNYYHGLAKSGIKFFDLVALKYRNKLIRKYGIDINKNVVIGVGLRIPHPSSIIIGDARIGSNFTILHNTTIGSKREGESLRMEKPEIGNNCIMYANSMVLGAIKVTDHVSIGCFSCLMKDADISGTYVGCPAELIKKKKDVE